MLIQSCKTWFKKIFSLLIHTENSLSDFDKLKDQDILNLHPVNDKYIYKNPDVGYQALYNNFYFGGECFVFTDFKQDITIFPHYMIRELHSFDWLQHLKIIDSGAAHSRITHLITSWISLDYADEQIMLRPNLLAKRIFNLLTSLNYFEFHDVNLSKDTYSSLSFQIRIFLHIYKKNDSNDLVGIYKTLFTIGKSLQKPAIITSALHSLLSYLDFIILPDGGSKLLCHEKLFRCLSDLVFVINNLSIKENYYSNALRKYIDKIVAFIKSIRNQDGYLSVFFSGYEGDKKHIDFILSIADLNAQPFKNLRYSGYIIGGQVHHNNILEGINFIFRTNQLGGQVTRSNKQRIDNSIVSFELNVGIQRVFVNNSSYNQSGGKSYIDDRLNYSSLAFIDNNGHVIDMPVGSNASECKVEQKLYNEWLHISVLYGVLRNSHKVVWQQSLYFDNITNRQFVSKDIVNMHKGCSLSQVVRRFFLYPDTTILGLGKNKKEIFLDIGKCVWVFKSSHPFVLGDYKYYGIKGEARLAKTLDIQIPLLGSLTGGDLEWTLFKDDTYNANFRADTNNY